MSSKPSKYAKKRKSGRDEDTSAEGVEERARRGSESPPPMKSKRRKEESNEGAESLSIEETNRLRASLGLAPLEVDNKPKPSADDEEDEVGEGGEKVIMEDGIELHHKPAGNLSDKKKDLDIREKIEVAKQKRKIQEKVLKAKKLADDADDDGEAASWVEKMRKQDEERKRALEREKMLNAMDEEFGVSNLMDEEKDKAKRKRTRETMKRRKDEEAAITAGLLVGHGKEAFAGGRDQILVLDDKSVLDDDTDEVLVNPNLIENERHSKNAEMKKRRDHYRPYDDAYDESGNLRPQQMLAKYDEELEGVQKKTFRLDERGEVDLAREEEEARMKARLEMAGKQLVSLEQEKFKVASDFFTQEEMISFRKPKKVKGERKSRKKLGKMLKADELLPLEDEDVKKDVGSRRRRNRHEDEEEAMETGNGDAKVKEEGELEDVDDGEGGMTKKGWKNATKGAVDIEALKRLIEREDEDSDEELNAPDANLAAIAIDDEATDELSSVLDRARRLKQEQARPEASDPEAAARRVMEMVERHGGKIKKEEEDEYVEGDVMEVEDAPAPDGSVYIDSTMEYCRNIGELTSYGIGGNRTDSIDVSTISRTEEKKKEKKEEGLDEFESVQKWKRAQAEKERRKRERKEGKAAGASTSNRGGWRDESTVDSDDERELEEVGKKIKEEEEDNPASDDDEEYTNVLGDEADLKKGVGAMLKLAAQKGYLMDPNAKRVSGVSLEHLQNKRATKMESERFDIEDKYVKKLERMGTTGSGPCRQFTEKKDYKPDLVIEYVDEKGRAMEPKDAFRVMSHKFHGKKPGKKQIEKRSARVDKKEQMLKMDSWDTPLGTLNKQIKKQEQMQMPYLVLSNTGKQTELKKH